ncbi:hypothetical protein NHJ13051_005962 [Beauveria bassiana]
MILHRLLVLSLSWGFSKALQASNFRVSKDVAESLSCGQLCQKNLGDADKVDVKTFGNNFDFDFYATAENFTNCQEPGKILKLKAIDPAELNVDPGVTAFRIQYTSVTSTGDIVPVTGFIAFPLRPSSLNSTQEGRYNLVALAHGTIGLFRGCAVSSNPALDDFGTWQPALRKGFAVVGTDYAGLGNNHTSHKYLNMIDHTNDVYYSTVAARELFGAQLSLKWMVLGHSLGGGTAWKLAESSFVKNDSSYVGSIALAPATYFVDMMREYVNQTLAAGLLFFVAEGAERSIYGYQGSFLTTVMRSRLQLAKLAQSCLFATFSLTYDIAQRDVLNYKGFQHDEETLLQWQKQVSAGQGARSPAPVLVIQGGRDTAILESATNKAYNKSCEAGNEIHYLLYPEQSHGSVIQAAEPDWVTWLERRFADPKSSPGRCSHTVKLPFRSEYVKAPGDFWETPEHK